jgi:deoxyribonuclease-4
MTVDPWPVDSLVSDIVKTHALGGYGVVLHIGKYLELEKKEAYKHLSTNLTQVLEMTEDEGIPILMETTAGQGTEIGFRFDELAEVYDSITQKDRVKFCLDTAHIFAAGYDIRTPEKVKETFDEFDRLLGLDNLKLVHLNDSKKLFGSRVDRHANFGADDANIGNIGITEVAKIALSRNIPIVIETPEKEGRTHKGDLKILRDLVR